MTIILTKQNKTKMRKFNLYCIVAFVGAMVLSLSSCTKDLEDDVDALKKEVAANKDAIKSIQDAINKGSVITNVESITGGFKITFSDGKSITVNHGTNGTNGANGADGAPGLPGAPGAAGENAYAPVLKVNAEGYWVVQTVKDGEFELVKDTAGLPIKAKGEDGTNCGITISDDGFIMVGDEKTSIGTPSVVKNVENNTLMITIWDTTLGGYFTYEVPLAGVDGRVATISAPFASFPIEMTYGTVVNTITGGPFASLNLTKDQLLVEAFTLALINPSNVDVDATKISFETMEEVELPLSVKEFKRGYNPEELTRAVGSGISTLILDTELTGTELTKFLADNNTDFVALKYANSLSDEVYSKFEFVLDATGVIGNLTFTAPAQAVNVRLGDKLIFVENDPQQTSTVVFNTIDRREIYKSRIALTPKYAKYAEHFDINEDGSSFTVKKNSASILALDGREIEFYFTAIDYNGGSAAYPNGVYDETKEVKVKVAFYNTEFANEYSLDAITHTLPEATVTASMTKFFNELGESKDYWIDYADQFAYDYTYLDINGAPQPATGIFTASLVDAKGVATSDNSEIAGIKLAIDPSKATIVDANGKTIQYYVTMTFQDKSNSTGKKYSIKIPVTFKNPATSSLLSKKSSLFSGQNLTIYGETQETPALNAYTLANAYNAVNGVVLTFKEVVAGVAGSAITTVAIPAGSLGVSKIIEVTGTLFGNTANTVTETIIVTPESSIEKGKMVLADKKTLELTYDKQAKVNAINVVETLLMSDAATKAVVFSANSTATPPTVLDPRLDDVEFAASGADKDLIKFVQDNKTGLWTIEINYTEQNNPTTDVVIPFTVTLTDQYDAKYVGKFNFTVKKKV